MKTVSFRDESRRLARIQDICMAIGGAVMILLLGIMQLANPAYPPFGWIEANGSWILIATVLVIGASTVYTASEYRELVDGTSDLLANLKQANQCLEVENTRLLAKQDELRRDLVMKR